MTARTHVVILCQGTQKRLTGVRTPKQLLSLPMHAASGAPNTTILGRTLMQVFRHLGGVGVNLENAAERYNDHRVTVVGWTEMYQYFGHASVKIPHLRRDSERVEFRFVPEVTTLAEPGNSSLRGISQYLAEATSLRNEAWPDRTVVLLGDVVYSWTCLRAIFDGSPATPDLAFVGTHKLTPSDGEIWGIMWRRSTEKLVLRALAEALPRSASASAEEYQSGQLRHWLWALDGLRAPNTDYIPMGGYTMDVDDPEDLVELASASLEAANDDRENGVIW